VELARQFVPPFRIHRQGPETICWQTPAHGLCDASNSILYPKVAADSLCLALRLALCFMPYAYAVKKKKKKKKKPGFSYLI
jgi:hypothetical protein